ncbi:RHS repeat protein [Chryseobacterium sp. PET-29]|uniref:RHS repeat protein n=1 Tax=Chryseobacterium sp. PET-29 TaxID=2983267 RepID=UPI0021E5E4F5|nr:RHS repeat protein [Chryseobacterium sp. PET-29]
MKNLKRYLTCILYISCQIIYAQGKTVEDYNLGKKINVSNNYNVGKLSLSVPLYDINLGRLSLKGTVDYQQEIPKTEPSMVGANWYFNMFGKITVAYKKPGDLLSPQLLGANTPSGFHSMGKNNCLISTPGNGATKKQLLTNPNTDTSFYTYEPNTFYFDFLGYTGYMVYDNVGKFLVYSENGNLTASWSGEKCHNIFQPILSFPEIVMKDDKGNEFYFGGDYNSMDIYYGKTKYNYSSFSDDGTFSYFTDFYTNRQTNYISAFYLKKVKLSNGRLLEAYYKNSNRTILDPFTNGGEYVNGDYPNGIPANNILLNNNIFLGQGNGQDFNNYTDTSSMNSWAMSQTRVNIFQKLAVIDSVKISDYGTLSFNYVQGNNTYTKPFLKKIQLKSYSKKIKDIDFNYNNAQLQEINNNNEKYSFTYYTGSGNNYQTDPSGISYLSGYIGYLKSVVYPTKGREEFIYEQNDVSKINFFTRSSYGTENNVFMNKDSKIDGQRLSMIQTFDNTNTQIGLKKYEYKNDDGTSSGILIYKDQTSVFVDDLNWFNSGTTTTSNSFKGYYDEYVRYSRVREEITGKEKNDYYFTDLITNPDSIATKVHSSNNNPSAPQIAQSKLPLKVNKNNERGKLYKMVKHNNDMLGVLVKNIRYTNFLKNAYPLNELSDNCTDCRISDSRYFVEAKAALWAPNLNNPSQLEYIGYYQYQPVLPYLPIAIETTEQIPYQTVAGNPVGSKLFNSEKYIKYNTKYLYWHPYEIETTENLSHDWNLPGNPPVYNGKIASRTYYPQDIIRANTACITGNCPPDNNAVGGKFSIYKYMANQNLVMPVIEARVNASNKTALEEEIYSKDAATGNLVMPTRRRTSLLDSNFSLDNVAAATVEDKETMELYDNLGNLLQSRSSNGIPNTTIYGYNQTLPIAEVKGATYSQVMQAFNLDPVNNTSYLDLEIVKKSNLDKNETAEADLHLELDKFRTKPELKDFQIETFAYDPLIGVKSVTDANGVKSSYQYDALNRPKKVFDANGDPIKTFDYNFAPTRYYNSYLIKTLYRNNCGSNAHGGLHLYFVPENKYFSTVSQADAEQMAENEAATVGQVEANTYGLCYPKSQCSLTMANNFVSLGSEVYSYMNNYNVVFKLSFRNYPINASYWNNEIQIAQIGGSCVPSVERTISNYVEPPGGYFGDTPANRTWRVRIDNAGRVYVKLLSGSVGNNSANPLKFEFEY